LPARIEYPGTAAPSGRAQAEPGRSTMMNQERDFEAERRRMVDGQIRARGVRDRRVLEAMARIPRHLFVPEGLRTGAYADEPLPIGEGQTISQPYIVAYMTEALGLEGGERVLEIGTGSGYQTAVLASIASQVFTIEIIDSLSVRARQTLESLGYTNIRFRTGDGSKGWPEEAPFDAVMVTAAASEVPRELENQLVDGGAMIVPVGTDFQELLLIRRDKRRMRRERLLPVRFVPLVRPRRDPEKGEFG
jgi:protein-L-isoaspartate(D-aspartate) O-methyltransferase